MNYKWRQPLALPAVTPHMWASLFNAYREGTLSSQKYPADSTLDDDIRAMYVAYRWLQSPKLICRVGKRAIDILRSTAFNDLQIKEIYLPEEIDCFQLVVEHDDPFVCDNIIFVRPDKADPKKTILTPSDSFRMQYFVITGTGNKARGLLALDPNQRIGDTIELFSGVADCPVNPYYLAVIAAVGFLVDSDQQAFYRHCVLKKDEVKYRAAVADGNKQTMRLLEERAIRRGKNERLFDTFSVEIGESEPQATSGEAFQGGSKRPHLRRGHFRAIRHGEGRRKVRMQWIPPLVVRKDLLTND